MAETLCQLSEQNFQEEVLESPIPVLVDFWAPWCMPCRMVAPIVEEIADKWSGKVKVCKLNTDEAISIAQKYGIQAIPTLIVFHQGREVDRVVGYVPKNQIEAKLQPLISK
ncbi:MAG: thioredoxin 1 [Candidatus Atribacteria bacterium]|nr:thioredoxin 1 [Candidatus Atribacteria bacterium]